MDGAADFLVRRTPVAYIVSVVSLGFSFLCRGGYGRRRSVPAGFVVEAYKKVSMNIYGKTEQFCCVVRFADDVMSAAKGGPSYWVVTDFRNERAEDLLIFNTQTPRVNFLG